MKNSLYTATRPISEQRGGRTVAQTRRPLEAVGRSFHCVFCGVTKVLLGSTAERVFHTCKSREGSRWLETDRTHVYGVPL